MMHDAPPKANDSEEDHLTPCFEFDQLGLDVHILQGIREQGFQKPTLIQGVGYRVLPRGTALLEKRKTEKEKVPPFV